jgi:Uma2 family endonuclease
MMPAVQITKLTEAEYLARERANNFRSEFYQGEMFAVAGATWNHNRIKSNFEGELYGKLKGGKCKAVSSDQRIKVDALGLYTYPDIAIVCGKAEFAKSDHDALINPLVIIEVLSPSNESYDRYEKFKHYKKLDSLREYILLAQGRVGIERYVRNGGGEWQISTLTEIDEVLTLSSIPNVSVKVADIYSGVEFPEPTELPRLIPQDRTPPGP